MTMAEALANPQPPRSTRANWPAHRGGAARFDRTVPRAELRLDSERVIRFGAQMIVRRPG